MGTHVAEYFGHRTDIDFPLIESLYIERNNQIRRQLSDDGKIPLCPYTGGNPCAKLKSGNQPVCSVRKSDGTLWITCPDRLCSTKKDLPLCDHQKNILLQVGRHIFSPSVTYDDICVKREVRLNVIEGTKYNADYIISLKSGRSEFSGPDRLILEMQGGGETTNTGVITNNIDDWSAYLSEGSRLIKYHNYLQMGEIQKAKSISTDSNEKLRTDVGASTLETNAWRRQQEQFIVKGNIAMKTWKGYGMAFCVGTLLFDYLMNKLSAANLPDLHNYNWTLAIIAFKEDKSKSVENGPIPLIVDENRLLYTNYQTFVQALINQGEPSLDAFRGDFINLNNEHVYIK